MQAVTPEQKVNTRCITYVDVLVCILIALFAFCAYRGSLAISAQGILIDSDLATYAQGIAGSARPELFIKDPVLHSRTPANSIMNAESLLARVLAFDTTYAVGLLRAGSVCIFFFFFSWYCFGRWLFRRRCFAVLLVAVVSITVWVGLGTFWGVTHSDPVPRVFHAACWPWMLMLAISAYRREAFRPIAMLVAGLSMWLHGVSALNTGAFFFCAFFFHKPKQCSFSRHGTILFMSLLAFFLPVFFFLAPSLFQDYTFSQEELKVFSSAFALRWQEDYGDIAGSLIHLLSPENATAYILYPGILACFLNWNADNERLRALSRMVPFFVLAFAVVTAFSFLESHYAGDLGRVAMGHELVRGVKFFIPLSWILICGAVVPWLSRLPTPVVVVSVLAVCLLTVFCSRDRQHIAAEYAVSRMTGISLPLTGEGWELEQKALLAKEALEEVKKNVHLHDTVFCLEDSMMALRYYAYCPLTYSFKDGYVYFYNKDVHGMSTWLAYTRLVRRGEDGVNAALKRSKARWYLTGTRTSYAFEAQLDKVWENENWRLYAVPKDVLQKDKSTDAGNGTGNDEGIDAWNDTGNDTRNDAGKDAEK